MPRSESTECRDARSDVLAAGISIEKPLDESTWINHAVKDDQHPAREVNPAPDDREANSLRGQKKHHRRRGNKRREQRNHGKDAFVDKESRSGTGLNYRRGPVTEPNTDMGGQGDECGQQQ